jgi:ABC-type phosphate transport system substrate-binding protein
MKSWMSRTAVGVGTATLAAVTLAAQVTQINGAGATFPNPIYSKWFSEYNKLHPNVQINYQSLGSGAGSRQLTSRTVFFGATDGPMTEDQMLAAPGRIVHLPTVLGAVVPVYNIPGVGQELKFAGDVLANIYLGRITKWNDPAIAALNPGVTLPGSDIVVDSVTAAASAAASAMPADFRVSITNPPGANAYPIASFTWLLLYENAQDKNQARIMVDFMKWALADGQKYARELGYAPLPQPIIDMELKALQRIKVGS